MICTNCNREIKDNAKFCPYCGAKTSFEIQQSNLQREEIECSANLVNNNEANQKSKKEKASPIVFLIIVFLSGLGITGFVFKEKIFELFNNSANDNQTTETVVEPIYQSANTQNQSNNTQSHNSNTIGFYIKIKSEIRIRPSASTSGDIIGHVYKNEIYYVYETKINGGYTWYRIGNNMWIADDGTWTERIPDDYINNPIVFPSTRVGSTVYFGSYEQDNNYNNGYEQIEWIILDNDGSRLLLISKYGLDSEIFNAAFTTWNDSSIRRWLNEYFYNLAFSDKEKYQICTSTNTTELNNENPSKDEVFLLSMTEVEKYWPEEADRICYGTQYAFANGVEDFDSKCRWWLRTLSPDNNSALNIRTTEGRINYVTPLNSSGYAVRPAIWVMMK